MVEAMVAEVIDVRVVIIAEGIDDMLMIVAEVVDAMVLVMRCLVYGGSRGRSGKWRRLL